ncbi:MAG: DUF1178 family protein [Candidatus Marinimicrobia bacterium]|nr:DUF1178 family protein [Candidatus Neomarinimicrobiota bacterium]
MIKYNLKCNNEHEFESWFSDSNEFDNLKKKKLLECIFCSSKNVNKSIMAPMISGIKINNNEVQELNENLLNEKDKLLKLRKFVENNFEYVEKNFSDKVREIYYDKKSKKAIYGNTTAEEREELEEEGIDLLSVPWVKKNN